MLGTIRGSFFALICSTALAGGGLTAATAQAIDTTGLPRLPGSRVLYANPSTTNFTTPDTVAVTGELISRALTADGWQKYGPAFAHVAQNPTLQILSFKRGRQALSAFIAVAPAQGNATSVSYTAVVLPNDLPFPKDATEIEFDYDRPHLNCVTGESVDATLAFFRKELRELGWSLWSVKDGARATGDAIGERNGGGGQAFYVREDRRPLLLTLSRLPDDRLRVTLRAVPAEMLVAASKRDSDERKAETVVAKTVTPPVKSEARVAMDDLTDDIMKQTMQMVRSATAEALSGAKAPPMRAPVPAAPEERLRAVAGGVVPLPVPETADDVEFDGARGKFEFRSGSSVASLASFYRTEMAPLGWKERPSVINRPNMVVLNFAKDNKSLSFTIMQMGPKVNVSASGAGLVTETARRASSSADRKTASAPAAIQELGTDETSGLPVPKESTMKGSEKTPFRLVINANVPADVASVAAFYRRELGVRSWKEDAPAAVVGADQAKLVFTSPEGPAVLKLSRKDDATIVELSLRKPAEATKAGVMPKPGQGKVLFGNVIDAEAVITINKKTVKVGAGVGSKAPDGPTLDLPPGKYKFSFKVGARPAQSDEVEIGADETWGVLIGPGGALALHAY